MACKLCLKFLADHPLEPDVGPHVASTMAHTIRLTSDPEPLVHVLERGPRGEQRVVCEALRCGFPAGVFVPDNWGCRTLVALARAAEASGRRLLSYAEHDGDSVAAFDGRPGSVLMVWATGGSTVKVAAYARPMSASGMDDLTVDRAEWALTHLTS